jgi:hypothetical protein
MFSIGGFAATKAGVPWSAWGGTGGHRVQHVVDLDAVRDDLAQVVTRSLEPAHLSVWVSSRY